MNEELATFLAVCARHRGGVVDAESELADASRDLMLAAEDDAAVMRHAAAALSNLPPHGAAWLAVMLGSNVERHPDAATGPAVLGVFLDWLDRLPPWTPDAASPAHTPEQAQIVEALSQYAPSVVSHLAANREWREMLAGDEALIETIEAREWNTHAITWVREALRRVSGTLIVLDTVSGNGLRVRYDNVGKIFHLLTLLQAAIGERLPGGRVPNARAVAEARGQAQRSSGDEAWWHYGDPRVPQAHLAASIWGEMDARDLPRVDDEAVIVLWPPLLASRQWDDGFFHPQIQQFPPDARVDAELTDAQAAAWFTRLGIQPSPLADR